MLGIMLSLLLHAGAAWALNWLPPAPQPTWQAPAPQPARRVKLRRAKPPREAVTPPSNESQLPFAKTSADEPEHRPEQADFVGKRDSVASGGPDAPQRFSDAPLPTMAGREREEEVVTFHQERQDGNLAHEGKTNAHPAPQPLVQGRPEGSAEQAGPRHDGSLPPQSAQEVSAAQQPEPPATREGLKLAERLPEDALTATTELSPPARPGLQEAEPAPVNTPTTTPHPRRAQAVMYDPSLAEGAQQPGLRTHERRTRSTGRFIFGRRPALNVAATARGRYEAEIYRRIARIWYAACDEHRGDIIPGSLTVSLRLTKNGRIDSMALVRRRGASLIQQSFSFGAIRHAALPPMPEEVQRDVIGRLYEMILTFNFD